MNEEKKEADTTEKQPDGSLTDAVITAAPSTDASPETSAVTTLSTEEAPKTDAPVTTVTEPLITTALPMTTTTLPVTTSPVTSAPVTTTASEAEPSKPSDKYDDEILKDLMYELDEDGSWGAFGKYITNYEPIDSVDYLLVLRSQQAYDEVNSALNGETEKTVTEIYDDFKFSIKLILGTKGVEFTVADVLGYEVIKLN